jgi:hypothetical protein
MPRITVMVLESDSHGVTVAWQTHTLPLYEQEARITPRVMIMVLK